jgi:phage shock protein A
MKRAFRRWRRDRDKQAARIRTLEGELTGLRMQLAHATDVIVALRNEHDAVQAKLAQAVLEDPTEPQPAAVTVAGLLAQIDALEIEMATLRDRIRPVSGREELLRERERSAQFEAEVDRLTRLSAARDQPHLTGWATDT